MARPPYYIRVFDSSPSNWFADKPDYPKLLKIFNLKDTEHSTYEVWDEIEEVCAVAAHLIASDKFEDRHIARFCESDLLRAGMNVNPHALGRTGIVTVDHSHRDLVGNADQLQKLLESVVERLRSGEDVIRSIRKTQLRCQLSRFVALPTWDRPTHTAHLCEVLLDSKTDGDVCRDRTRATTELRGIRIPERAIRPRAYSRWDVSGQPEGSAVADWFAIEAIMRDEYRDHYLAHCLRT